MDNIDFTRFDEDGFNIRLEGPAGLIAVETLIETLDGFSQSLRAIGAAVDPRFELEVYVHSIAPGSVNIGVRLKQRPKKKKAGVYAAALGSQVIIGLFTNYLWEQIRPQEKCEYVDDGENVVVKGSNCNATFTRRAFDLKPRIDGNPKVAKGVEKALKAVKKDSAVKSVGVGTTLDAPLVVAITREHLDEVLLQLDYRARPRRDIGLPRAIAQEPPALDYPTRQRNVRAHLIVIGTNLGHDTGTWRFSWEGVEISATVSDSYFHAVRYDPHVALQLGALNTDYTASLSQPHFSLRQGDGLDVSLSITERFLANANVWLNHAYSVTKVYSLKRGDKTIDFVSPDKSGRVASKAPSKLPPTVGDAEGFA